MKLFAGTRFNLCVVKPVFLVTVFLLTCRVGLADEHTDHTIPYLPATDNAANVEGILRVINHSSEAGSLTIQAYDEDGRSYESVILAVSARSTTHITSKDIEVGNPDKNLTGSTGSGRGPWRLQLTSTSDIEVLTYARSSDGFLASIHDVVPSLEGRHELSIFNPASESTAFSELRLVNLGDVDADVSVTGIDDTGSSPASGVSIPVPAGTSLAFTVAELEAGDETRFTGSIGDGTGAWRLTVDANPNVVVMNLHRSEDGRLTNLSTATVPAQDLLIRVPLLSASKESTEQQDFVRISNREATSATVTIAAYDDAGKAFESLTLALPANHTKHLSAMDLENGNEDLGLTGSTGKGEGNWRLDISSESDLSVSSYVETEQGLISVLHDTAPKSGKRHRVAMFNTGNSVGYQSALRLVNPNDDDAFVRITGFDESGISRGTEVKLTIPKQGAKELSAQLLEAGSSEFEGAFGFRASEHVGTWRVTVHADQPILAMSLIADPQGFVGNVSTAPQRGAGPVESATEAFETQIEPIIAAKCSRCHVERGFAQSTRLVFETGSDASTYNQSIFENFIFTVENGATRILTKIRGGDRHGGGVQVAANSTDWSNMQQFLTFLGNEKVAIGGRAWLDSAESKPLADASCHFNELRTARLEPGESLAQDTTDEDGDFSMRTASDKVGFLTCAPKNLPLVRLMSFVDLNSTEASSVVSVSPRTTVIALVLMMDQLRKRELDPSAYVSSLSSSLNEDENFKLMSAAATALFGALQSSETDYPFDRLLIDAFGNGAIDDKTLPDEVIDVLNESIGTVSTDRARAKLTLASSSVLADYALLAASQGIDDPVIPPPWSSDPDDLEELAKQRTFLEFARSPAAFYMNAHWAHARGFTGNGEIIGMVDTGLFAAHHDFSNQLHDETVFTVIDDDNNGDGHPDYSYFKIRDADPAETYPTDVQPDHNQGCLGVFCKFYYYFHGTYMASLAIGRVNGIISMGLAYESQLYFEPMYQQGTLRGFIYYHPPGTIVQPHIASRHQIVRDVGNVASVVSNSWLTGTSSFQKEPYDYKFPFHQVLTPRYVEYQRHRHATNQSLILFSAGNRPLAAGPLVDGAVVPSLSERQVRALTDGDQGLADLLLTPNERNGLSAAAALREAQLRQDALKRRWLTVVAPADYQQSSNYKHVLCIDGKRTDAADCAVNWVMNNSSRCGFASDWCVAVGPSAGGVYLDEKNPPPRTGRYIATEINTSEATALAASALGLLLEAYRDEKGTLTVGTNAVLKRLKTTAKSDFFDPEAKQEWDQRNTLIREEEMIRSLILYAGASDDDLRELMRVTRLELNSSEEDPYTAPESSFGAETIDRYRIFNRFVHYWATMQTGEFQKLLNAAHDNEAHRRDLLAQLIRQIEWIDTQLLRLGKTKDEVTDEDVRKIALTSLVGHGMIDLRAATEPLQEVDSAETPPASSSNLLLY